MSLARVRIELGGEHDEAFGLNVQKSKVQVPEGFVESVADARSEGISFVDFLRFAEETYRASPGPRPVEERLILGRGTPAQVRQEETRDLDKGTPTADVAFIWRSLPEEQFFELDKERPAIVLNARYRRAVLNGGRASVADAPLVKVLLFSRLREELGRERLSSTRARELDALQRTLVMAARQQR
jgi:hypothetical protein